MILVRTVITPLIILLLSASSCNRLDVQPERARKVKVIGHGGVGFQSPRNQLPHNSLQSVTKAVEFYGAHGVEVDVQMSKSGSLWLYHDQTLETQTNCNGCIIQKTDEELEVCRFNNDVYVNAWNKPYFLVKLNELLERFKQYPELPYLFLDVRSAPVCDEVSRDSLLRGMTRELVQFNNEYGNTERLYLTLRDRELIEQVKRQIPEIKILYEAPVGEEQIEFVKVMNLTGMILKERETDREAVEELQKELLEVCLFGVKTQERIVSAVNKTPDFIMPDNIPLTLHVLKAARD